MLAAKLIGELKEEKGLNRLVELLHDQTWWVRFQAGQAIWSVPKWKGNIGAGVCHNDGHICEGYGLGVAS